MTGKSKYIDGKFWTSKQRVSLPLHEVAYRACFKPAIPEYFIYEYSSLGDIVLDPFSGRGTTGIQAALMGRSCVLNDINPLGVVLAAPRINIPDFSELETRLEMILSQTPILDKWGDSIPEADLLEFFHPETLSQIGSMRGYFCSQTRLDSLDAWIQMVATNRLSGHSAGFLSRYTLPPNQAVSPKSQRKINERIGAPSSRKDVRRIIIKRTKSLLRGLSESDIDNLRMMAAESAFLSGDASSIPISNESVHLTVTSPPFLDVVDYAGDNWLRCWFNGISAIELGKKITSSKTVGEWETAMYPVFAEILRVSVAGAHLAWECGEVKNGSVSLDDVSIAVAESTGWEYIKTLVNSDNFTKTSQIWGMKGKGTQSNRVALFKKRG